MNKYIILIIFFVSKMFQSQIRMEYFVMSHNESYQLKINIINSSNDYYALPLDINGFKGYVDSEYCGFFDDQDYPYHFFAPTIMLKKENTSEYLIPASSRGHIPEGEGAEEYINDLENVAEKEKEEIVEWKKKNGFKSYKEAIENRYITKNLILLKPQEKFSYEILLDLGNISRTPTSALYDYYFLEFSKYDLSLHLCIKDESYNWLTKQQKQKIKKYKLFTGVIKSNSYIFKAYE